MSERGAVAIKTDGRTIFQIQGFANLSSDAALSPEVVWHRYDAALGDVVGPQSM